MRERTVSCVALENKIRSKGVELQYVRFYPILKKSFATIIAVQPHDVTLLKYCSPCHWENSSKCSSVRNQREFCIDRSWKVRPWIYFYSQD